MTISSISSGASFAHSGVDMDAEGQLALLVLEQEDAHAESAHDDKAIARRQFLDASHKEVEAMHAEATHILEGAVIGGSIGVLSSGCQFASIGADPGKLQIPKDATPKETSALILSHNAAAKSSEYWGATGAALDKIGKPIAAYVGDSNVAHDHEHAKQAATSAQVANWSLDDANQAIDKSEKRQEKTLDWLSSESANKASTETAIIAGFA